MNDKAKELAEKDAQIEGLEKKLKSDEKALERLEKYPWDSSSSNSIARKAIAKIQGDKGLSLTNLTLSVFRIRLTEVK